MIRFLEEGHIPEVAMAQVLAWQKAFRGILSNALLDTLEVADFINNWQTIIQKKERSNLVFLNNKEQALAFISYGPTQEEESIQAEIYGIYVHPEYWNQNIGSALIEEALLNLQSEFYSEVILWTMTENTLSRDFYEKMGFQCTEERNTSSRSGEEFEEIKYIIQL